MGIRTVFFTSRQLAESVVGKPDMAVISITDPGTPPAQLDPHFRHVLRLSFLDAVAGDDYMPAPIPGLFDTRMARQIAEFITQMRADPDNDSVLVHCECGVSRSAAVALFIAAYAPAPLTAREFTHKANPWVISRFEQLFPELNIDVPPMSAAHERRSLQRD